MWLLLIKSYLKQSFIWSPQQFYMVECVEISLFTNDEFEHELIETSKHHIFLGLSNQNSNWYTYKPPEKLASSLYDKGVDM